MRKEKANNDRKEGKKIETQNRKVDDEIQQNITIEKSCS